MVDLIIILRKIACKDFGGTVKATKLSYRSMIGGILDYSASTLLPMTKDKLSKLESIQLKAARIILGAPMCVIGHILRAELGLKTIETRLTEMATGQLLRTITTEKHLRKRMVGEQNNYNNRWLNGAKVLMNRETSLTMLMQSISNQS